MWTVFFTGLTFGIVGKYIIHGNYSRNFIVPIIVGLIGAYFGQLLIGEAALIYNDPISLIAVPLGSIFALALYWLINLGLQRNSNGQRHV